MKLSGPTPGCRCEQRWPNKKVVLGLLVLICLIPAFFMAVVLVLLRSNADPQELLLLETTQTSGVHQPILVDRLTPFATSTKMILPTAQPPKNTPATSHPTAITENPDEIVYTCDYGTDQICMINVDGSEMQQLTSIAGATSLYAAFAPGRESVVFSNNQTGSYQIYELILATNQLIQLTTTLGHSNGPDISPDGAQIVYKYEDPTTLIDSVWLMNRDGSNASQLISEGWDPVWSPDGQAILFAAGNTSQPQLYIYNFTTGVTSQVTNLPHLRGRSDWSVDGWITSYYGVSGSRRIFRIRPDGSQFEELTHTGNSLGPSFSPDGQWIAFTSYDDPAMINCDIYVMKADGSDIRKVTSNLSCDWQPRWQP